MSQMRKVGTPSVEDNPKANCRGGGIANTPTHLLMDSRTGKPVTVKLRGYEYLLEDALSIGMIQPEDALLANRYAAPNRDIWIELSEHDPAASESGLAMRFGDFLLLCFLPKKDRERIVDDLHEEFEEAIIPRVGIKLARKWYVV